MFSLDWIRAEKQIDTEFEGSLEQALGYDPVLCPTCGAHLHGGICLNACHLSDETRQKFVELMNAVAMTVTKAG